MLPELVSFPAVLILWAVVGYLAGSIPSGILIARAMNLGNLREIGSGNIGATNVLRTGSKKAAVLTLLFDAIKAVVPILLALWLAAEDAAQVAALAAFIGHCFPVWLGFRGGKGVATFFGVLFALDWRVGLAAGATWIACAAVTRYSSLSALIAAVAAPVYVAVFGSRPMILLTIALGALILARHHANIARLLAGTESRIGRK